MPKPYRIALLFAIGLWLVLPVGHGIDAPAFSQTIPSGAISLPPAASTSPKPTEIPSLAELKAAHDSFRKALETYIYDLEAIAKTPKDQRTSQLVQLVDYQALKNQLDKVRQSLDSLRPSLSQLPDQDKRDAADEALDKANAAINQMQDMVLTPLSQEGGLNNVGALTQIQKSIPQLKDNKDVQEASLGEYGEITFSGIKTFLNQQDKELAAQIDQLQNIAVNSPPISSRKPSVSSSGKLTDSALFWAILAISFWVAITLVLLVSLWKIYQFLYKKSKKINSAVVSQKATDQIKLSTTPSNLPINNYQNLFNRVNEIAAKLLRQQKTSSDRASSDLLKQIDGLAKRLLNQEREIKELRSLLQSNRYQGQPSHSPAPTPGQSYPDRYSSGSSQSGLSLKNLSEAQLVAEKYHHTPHLFQVVETVSLTEESQSNLWVGKSDLPEFESHNQGSYSIITDLTGDRQNQYLVPKLGLRLNENNLKSLANLYDFENSPDATRSIDSIKLTKLAVVSPQNNRESWRLEERGQLFFG
jgi:hypothetical protein